MQKLLYIVIAVVILLVMLRVSISYFSANRVATGLTEINGKPPTLSGCDGLLNCTSSTASNSKNKIAAISYEGKPNEAIEKIAKMIATQSGTSIVTQSATYLHATYQTPIMGYTDDLELLLDEATGTMHVRSASRMGKSDLGANRKRIDALQALLIQHPNG